MKKKVIICGTGVFSEVVYYYFSQKSNYKVIAFTESGSCIKKEKYLGLPVIPFESVEKKYPPFKYAMFIAIGYRKLNKNRANFFRQAKNKGYSLVSYVYPDVKIWPNTLIGENVFIFENNTIQPFTKIGNNSILWSGNHIGHHASIGNHCFITSHVVISGNTSIGDYSFIGVNATIRDNISIGRSNIIGAGALVMKSTKDKELYITKRTEFDVRSTDQIDF